MPLHYIAYSASEELKQKTEKLVESCELDEPPKDLGQQAANVAHEMMNDAVNAYVIAPIDTIKLSKVTGKLIKGFSKVMVNTSRSLINKTVAPLEVNEVRRLTDHMINHHLELSGNHYVAFEISPAFYQTMQEIISDTNHQNLEHNKVVFASLLAGIGNETIAVFLLKPIELISVGPLTRRFINVSQKTMQHSIETYIPKLVKSLSLDEFRDACGLFSRHLLISG